MRCFATIRLSSLLVLGLALWLVHNPGLARADSANLVGDMRRASFNALQRGLEWASRGEADAAIAEFEKAAAIDAENHAAWYAKGKILAFTKQWAEAAAAFEKASSLLPDEPMYHLHLGMALAEMGDPRGFTHLARAVELQPDLYRAHYHLGILHRANGRHREAAESFTQAARRGFVPAFAPLAELYMRWSHQDHARQVLEQGITIAQGQKISQSVVAELHQQLGLVHEAMGNIPAALAAYTQAIAIEPDFGEAYLQRGLLFAQQGNRKQAIADLRHFSDEGLGTAFTHSVAVEALRKLGAAP